MKPPELFRFWLSRAPRARRRRIDLHIAFEATPFSRRLLEALRGPAHEEAFAIAESFLDSGVLPINPRDNPMFAQLIRFFQRLTTERPSSPSAASAIVADIFGGPPDQVVASDAFEQARLSARDASLALKLHSSRYPNQLATYAQILQGAEFLRQLALESESIDFARPLAALRAPLRLPDEFRNLRPAAPDAEGGQDGEVPGRVDEEVASLAARAARLERALLELSTSASEFARVRPADASSDRIVLAPAAHASLSASTRATLEAEGIDVAGSSFMLGLHTLENARAATLAALTSHEAIADEPTRMRIGTLLLPAVDASPMIPLDPAFQDPTTRPPTTVGPVRPSSVGQLLITRQQIKRYEAGEISHVQNVLLSEKRERSTRRLRRTEETFLIEEEKTEEEERDLQTTDRFGLKNEMQNTLSNAKAFDVGTSVSAGYGPYVQTEFSTGFETNSSTEQAETTASEFAREMTARTVSRLSQRIRTEQTRATIEEFEENNAHAFDNTGGDGHVVGIYQWLDRIYEMQVFDYGIRLIFEFTVPEPSALYLKALDSKINDEGLRRPRKITFEPNQIDASNYHFWVREFGAEGVEPPPTAIRTVSHAFSHASPDGTSSPPFAAEAEVTIPKGYVAIGVRAAIRNDRPSLSDSGSTFNRIDLVIGDQRMFQERSSDGTITNDLSDVLPGISGKMAVAVTAIGSRAFAASVTIECLRSPTHYEQWQLATFEALVRARAARESEYEERLAVIATQEASKPPGRNPTLNRIIERNEIKRLAIMMMSGQRFKSTSVPLSPQAAEFDFDRALAAGNYARFWEQVIEWENLDYLFHPYYWGRQTMWNRFLTEDVDQQHAMFIAAGSATLRLVARPGWEPAILHFLETGEIWNGGDLPEVTTDEYIAFLDEIDVRRPEPVDPNAPQPLGGGAPAEEVPFGDPWEERLPTTLVRLRDDSSLPAWVKDDLGNWVPADED